MNKYYLIATLCLTLCGCAEDKVRVYETVSPKLYFVESGLVDLTSSFKDSSAYTAWVYRSGNTDYEIDSRIELYLGGLVSYNVVNEVDYQLLPASCYSLQTTDKMIGADTHMIDFEVGFDSLAIAALEEDTYVLPLRLRSERAEINHDKRSVLLLIEVR